MTTDERRALNEARPMLRNMPMRSRAWRELLERDDAATIEGDTGALVLAVQDGQLNLHYAFTELEEMRLDFVPMFDDLTSEIESFEADYVRIDLIQIPDRTWIVPLLLQTSFTEFGEWMDMVHYDLNPDAPPPDFPDEVSMRRGGPEDFGRIVEIESAAYDEFADGEPATRLRLESAAWIGVLDRDGEPVAYAINGPVERAEGRVLSAAVDPAAWGNGYGSLMLGAAIYQLTANEARRAVMRVRPDISQGIRTARDLGFSPGTSGVEFRRPTDEQVIAERHAQKRAAHDKVKLGPLGGSY